MGIRSPIEYRTRRGSGWRLFTAVAVAINAVKVIVVIAAAVQIVDAPRRRSSEGGRGRMPAATKVERMNAVVQAVIIAVLSVVHVQINRLTRVTKRRVVQPAVINVAKINLTPNVLIN